MAITITSTPSITKPHAVNGKDNIIVKWSSNSANIVNCIVSIQLGDTVSTPRVSVVSVQPDKGTSGASSTFTLVLNNTLQNFLSFNEYSTTLSTYDLDVNGSKLFGLRIYEVTLDSSTGELVTDYLPDDATTTPQADLLPNRVVYNTVIDVLSKNSFDVTDYELISNTKKFLTDSPSTKEIELNKSEYLGALYRDGSAPNLNFKIEYLTYNSSDALLNTDYINITDWDVAYSGKILAPYITIPTGTANLIAAGISLTNVAYYTVKIINNNGDMSELKRYNIVDSCTHDVRIHWQNKYGKRDSYTFKGNKQESLKHKASTFMTAEGLTYSSTDGGLRVLQNTITNSFTVYSKSLGRNEYHWLSDMLINKRAFVEIDGAYYPIIIEDGTFFKTDERDMPIQFVLQYKLANETKGLKG